MMTALSILAGLALTLGAVSWGMDVWQAGALESNKSYSAAALDQVRQHQAQAELDLAAARRQGDPIAVAQAQVRRDGLALLEERWDPSAAVRQAEQARTAFIEEGQRKAAIDIGARIVSSGVGGFGKVQGSYMRGTNWPPTASSVVVWDPQAGQSVRIILGTARPTLEIVEFKDNLEDAMAVTMGLFDVLKGTAGSGGDPLTARETYEGVRAGLERLQELDALPNTIGGYVAEAAKRQVQAANPQLATLTAAEQKAFVQQQACARLQALWQAESERTRSESYATAMAQLGCPAAASRAALDEKEADTDESEAQEVAPEVQVSEPVAPVDSAPAGVWVTKGPPSLLAHSASQDDWDAGYYFVCRATETALAFDEVVREGGPQDQDREVRESLKVSAEIEAPPDVLTPGETIALDVTFRHSGQTPARRPHTYSDGLRFYYSGQATKRYFNDPSLPLGYYPYLVWDRGVPGPTTVTWNLPIPEGRAGDTLQITAKYGRPNPCSITWHYQMD